MDWKPNGKGNWIAVVVARNDSNHTHHLHRTQKAFTENGELTVLFTDDDGAAHTMTFAAGVWAAVEIYLPTPPQEPTP